MIVMSYADILYCVWGGGGGTIRGPKKWLDQQQNILNAINFAFVSLACYASECHKSGLKVYVQSGREFGHSSSPFHSSPFQRLYSPPPPPPCIQCFASWLSMCKVEMALINISSSN